MRTETRRELLDVLEELGRQYPDMRFGQLVVFVARLARGSAVSAVYDVDDEELLREARSTLAVKATT